jgi:uncharacterized protein
MSMAVATPMFIADAALGRLVTWLRLLGYDTACARDLDLGSLVRRALAEGRIVLTRNTRLVGRRALPRVVFVRADDYRAQLRQVIDACALTALPAFLHRCARCNTLLEPLARADACMRVPAYVRATQTTFAHCPTCARIYWPATHVERMQRELVGLGLRDD